MSDWEPKIAAFLCNWCSYGAADLAGVGRMEYPANIRVIRIPCTGHPGHPDSLHRPDGS
jgi:coenzyme F420-reducing hydrogenase delta subunit